MTTRQPTPLHDLEQLVGYFLGGNKSPDRLLIGVEHEKFGFRRGSIEPIDYATIQKLLGVLAERYAWHPIIEGDYTIALTRRHSSITLEPGGQVEWSGAPFASLHDNQVEFEEHLQELIEIGDDLGIDWVALGQNPITALDDVPHLKKERYTIMRRYLPTRGRRALEMMHRTCTVQANLDWIDEADATHKFRTAMAVSPLITAMFANSPLTELKANGAMSDRYLIWLETDPDRCGLLEFVFDDGFCFDDYLRYVLDVPMFFIVRDGRYIDLSGRSFKEFVRQGYDGHSATFDDWETHLSTVFTEARMKHHIEVRGADSISGPLASALPAIWKGLLYDDTAREAAWQIVADLPFKARQELVVAAGRDGLGGTITRLSVLEGAKELLRLAQQGLERLAILNSEGRSEALFLEPLEELLSGGRSPAELLLEQWDRLQSDPLALIQQLKYR